MFCCQTGLSEHATNRFRDVVLPELPRRQIHRHRQVSVTGGMPRLDLSASGLEHPLANRDNQSRLFSQGNKARRRDHAELGMLPADQSLYTRNPAALEIDLGLVIQLEFLPLQGPT